jgi:hypothetical protein
MSKDQTEDLLRFLKPFSAETIDLVTWLRNFAWDACPQANELIYDNYNALAVGWSLTDRVTHTICSIAVWRTGRNIHFGFYWGSELSDPDKILSGRGNQYRYVLVTDKKTFPKACIKKLVSEAYAIALSKVKDQKQIIHGQTIVKSVSDKKRTAKGKKESQPKQK